MDFIYIFGLWISCLQISLLALPLSLVHQWRKRGSSEGFSTVQLLVPIPIQLCWFVYGSLTSDYLMMITNAILLSTSIVYFLVFIYYLPEKSSIGPLLSIASVSLLSAMIYVFIQPHSEVPKNIVDRKTTEFLPYQMPFIMCAFLIQNVLYSFLAGKYPVVWASIPGLLFNTTFIVMYVIYPPKTWRVPILGTGKESGSVKNSDQNHGDSIHTN